MSAPGADVSLLSPEMAALLARVAAKGGTLDKDELERIAGRPVPGVEKEMEKLRRRDGAG